MADERVVIKIEVKSDDREIDRTRRKLERLAGVRERDNRARRKADRDEGLASRGRRNRIQSEADGFDKVSRKYKKRFDSFDKMIKMTGTGLMKFLAMTAKAVALEMAAMGAAMVGVHLAFAAGKLIMKAYHGVMKLVAGGMAGVAIAAGTVAAALREQQAAMYAFSGRGQAKEFGSALNQTRVQMRALTMDASLAAVGVENLVQVYGEVSKTSKFTAGSKATLKGLMDFASAGMDMKEGTKQAGALIATLQDTKKTYSDVVTAGKKFSPQMKKALEEYEKTAGKKGKTKDALAAAMRSGELAKLGGVDGQFAAVSGTLINTLKGEFNMLRGMFADFGQQFLGPIKKEAKEVFAIVSNALKRTSGQIGEFGQSGFIDKISVVVQKVTDFFIRTTRDYLPQTMGIFGRIGDWWDRFTDGWNRIKTALEPFIHGAKVVEGILKQAWLPVWDQIQKNMYSFNDQLQANQPALMEFGTNIGNLLAKVMEYFHEARKLFFQALPFINKVIKGFTSLIELFTSFLGGFTKLTGGTSLGGVGSLAMLIGLARGMKNTKGYFTRGQSMSGIREVANMNVNARVIYLNGKPVAQYGRPGMGGSAGVVQGTNAINTGGRPGVIPGPYMGRPGGGGGGGGGGGLASTGGGVPRGRFIKTPYGGAQAGTGPHGGQMMRSGRYKGYEMVTQMERGRPVTFFQHPTSGAVKVPGDQRMLSSFGREAKGYTADGRIITRKERFARFFGEKQRHAAGGFGSDSRLRNAYDRGIGRRIRESRLGDYARRVRDREIANSNYLTARGPMVVPPGGPSGPSGPYGPPGGATGQGWLMTSNRAYGPGTYDPNSLRGRFFNGRLYNNWLSPSSGIGSNGPLERRTKIGRAIQSARLAAGDTRKSRLGQAVFGDGDKRKGFQGSGMAGMGVMMGMGMLAQSGMVSEEAQGFLSAGAMVGMMNPLAGLAIGLGGTALTAKTAAGGAVSGAAAGAAIGTMIAPGFGTAAGAIIGTAVGALVGRANRIKEEKKQARKAFESVFDKIVTDNLGVIQQNMMASGGVGKSEIVKAAGSGGRISQQQNVLLDMFRGGASNKELVEYMAKNSQQFGLDDKQVAAMRKRPEETTKSIVKVETRQKAMNHLTDVYANRLKELTAMTGKSEQEIELMAMELGVNLYDATTEFNDVVQQLGYNVIKTREQLRGLQMDVAIQGLEKFKKQIDSIADPQIVSEQARAFRDLYDAANGVVTDSEFADFIYGFTPNLLNYAGGGLQGAFEMKRMFGVGGSEFSRSEGVEGTPSFITSPLYGMEKLFTESQGGMALQSYINETLQSQTRNAAGQVNALLYGSASNNRFQVDAQMMAKALENLDPSRAKQFATDLESGTLFGGVDIDKLTRDQFVNLLSGYGFRESDLGLRAVQDQDALNIALDKMPEELRTTYGEVIKMFGAFFDGRDEKPEWMTDKFIKFVYENGDTSSPRGKGVGDTTSSRLAQTMGRHSAMDGMLTGNRTVTSAFRTYGLGSTNSDHVTGRAYDLVGQNLGQYQRLVHANGGFAEFHGRNASRHLHVVPGPGAYGDAVSPKIMSPMPMRSGGDSASGGITIQQTIYGNTNADDVAEAAVRKMKLALENERHRR